MLPPVRFSIASIRASNVSAEELFAPIIRMIAQKRMNLRKEQVQLTGLNRIYGMKFPRQLLFAVTLLVLSAAPMSAAESLNQTIDYLLQYVVNSKAVFVRNGTTYTPDEAVDHIKAKYAHFKNDIKTPEDFIRLSASKSLLSGKPYLVRTPDGKEMRLDAWLTKALEEHRAATYSG